VQVVKLRPLLRAHPIRCIRTLTSSSARREADEPSAVVNHVIRRIVDIRDLRACAEAPPKRGAVPARAVRFTRSCSLNPARPRCPSATGCYPRELRAVRLEVESGTRGSSGCRLTECPRASSVPAAITGAVRSRPLRTMAILARPEAASEMPQASPRNIPRLRCFHSCVQDIRPMADG